MKGPFLAGLVRVFLLIFLSLIAFVSGFAVQGYIYIPRDIPSIEKIKNYELPIVTQVFADDGELIAEFYNQRRFPVPVEEIPQILQDAFVVTEDQNYWKSRNVDIKNILQLASAVFRTIKTPHGPNGLTPSMTPNLLCPTPKMKLKRALKETILTCRIENELTKEYILHVYLNQIYFGAGSYGVEAAAQTYFRKSV